MAARLSGSAKRAGDEASADQQREALFLAETDRSDLLSRLRTATPAQINTWIDGNVTNLAQARAVLKAILKLLALNARK